MLRKNPFRHVAGDAEDLAAPGPAGVVSIVALGILAPLGIGSYAVWAWLQQSCAIFGADSDMRLTGDAARSMAVGYFAVALFCHARFCWGALGREAVHKVLAVIACCGFIGGVLFSIVYALA